jgi:hypothetical protein
MEKIDAIREILKSGNHCMAGRSEGHMRFLLAEYDRLTARVGELETDLNNVSMSLIEIKNYLAPLEKYLDGKFMVWKDDMACIKIDTVLEMWSALKEIMRIAK